MTKCIECGYENVDGLDYCDGCGAKLNAVAQAETPVADAATPPAEPARAEEASKAESGPAEAVAVPASEAATGEIKPPDAAAAVQASAPAPAEPAAAPSAAPAAFKAKLIVVRGGRKGQEFPLEDGNNLVGRWDPETGAFPEVDLDADDPEAKISRKHALIRVDGGKVTIEDIGSLNGTYVDRQPRLAPGNPVEIKMGAEVIIGKTFLKLVVEPVS